MFLSACCALEISSFDLKIQLIGLHFEQQNKKRRDFYSEYNFTVCEFAAIFLPLSQEFLNEIFIVIRCIFLCLFIDVIQSKKVVFIHLIEVNYYDK